jgi:hypothetical protein
VTAVDEMHATEKSGDGIALGSVKRLPSEVTQEAEPEKMRTAIQSVRGRKPAPRSERTSGSNGRNDDCHDQEPNGSSKARVFHTAAISWSARLFDEQQRRSANVPAARVQAPTPGSKPGSEDNERSDLCGSVDVVTRCRRVRRNNEAAAPAIRTAANDLKLIRPEPTRSPRNMPSRVQVRTPANRHAVPRRARTIRVRVR